MVVRRDLRPEWKAQKDQSLITLSINVMDMLDTKRTCDLVVGDHAGTLGLGHASPSTARIAPVRGFGGRKRRKCVRVREKSGF